MTVEEPIVATKPSNTWEIKDRVYYLKKGLTPLTYTIRSRGIFFFDEEKGYERELKYTVNQKTSFVDEFKGDARLGHIVFEDGVLNVPKEKQTLQKLLAKRAAKTTAKLIPGVDIGISAGETWGYLAQGRLDQAGIAALSGAIGWVPLVGDAASATLDLANTGIDIARLDPNSLITNQKTKTTQPDLNIGSKRFKFNPVDQLSFRSFKGL